MSPQAGGEAVGMLLCVGACVMPSRTWVRTVLAVFGVCLGADALAYDAKDIRSEYVANRTINTATQFDKSWTPTNSGDGVRVGKNFVMKAPGGRTAAAEAVGLLSRGVVMRLAASAVPLVGAVGLAYELYDAYRIHAGSCEGDALCFDPGTAQESHTGTAYRGYTADPWQYTPAAACATAFTTYKGDVSPNTYLRTGGTSNVTGTGPYTCQMQYTEQVWTAFKCGGGGTGWSCGTTQNNSITLSSSTQTQLQCPDEGQTVGIDGLCATGEYTQGLTPQEAADIAMAHANAAHPDLAALTAEALGVVPLVLSDSLPIEVEAVDPEHHDGPVKTTTKVENGDTIVQTEAIGWDWSRDPIRKNEGKWVETKTKTTTTNGVQTGEETTTEEGDTPGDKTDAVNQCLLNPDASGCAEFGDPGPASTLPTVALPASMDDTINFGAETAACPANRPIETQMAGTLYFSWEGPCMFADGIRPVVVGMAYLAAVLSFFGIGRRD